MGAINISRLVLQIIQYCGNPGNNFTDEVDGHGTHVAGIIAGQALSADSPQYNGVAPNAKLIVFDLALPGGGITACGADCLYYPSYYAGSRIHTNSWGSSYSGSGSYYGSDVDIFLYYHPESAIFFAAGNSGGNGAGTLTMEWYDIWLLISISE